MPFKLLTVVRLDFRQAETSICTTRLSNAKFFLIQANGTNKDNCLNNEFPHL